MISNVAEYYFTWYHLTLNIDRSDWAVKKHENAKFPYCATPCWKITRLEKTGNETLVWLRIGLYDVRASGSARIAVRHLCGKSNFVRCLWCAQTLTIQGDRSNPGSIQRGKSARGKDLNMTSLYSVRFVHGSRREPSIYLYKYHIRIVNVA